MTVSEDSIMQRWCQSYFYMNSLHLDIQTKWWKLTVHIKINVSKCVQISLPITYFSWCSEEVIEGILVVYVCMGIAVISERLTPANTLLFSRNLLTYWKSRLHQKYEVTLLGYVLFLGPRLLLINRSPLWNTTTSLCYNLFFSQ